MRTRSAKTSKMKSGVSGSDLPTRNTHTCAITKLCLADTKAPSRQSVKSAPSNSLPMKSSGCKTYIARTGTETTAQNTDISRLNRQLSELKTGTKQSSGTKNWSPVSRSTKLNLPDKSASRRSRGSRIRSRSRTSCGSFDEEMGVRIVRRRAPLATPGCVIFWVLSLLVAVVATVAGCYFLREDADISKFQRDLATVQSEHASLSGERDGRQKELDLILANIAKIDERKPITMQKPKSWVWKVISESWLSCLLGSAFGLFGGYAFTGCSVDGNLSPQWTLAKQLRDKGTGFGDAGTCKADLGDVLGKDVVVGCNSGSNVTLGRVPKPALLVPLEEPKKEPVVKPPVHVVKSPKVPDDIVKPTKATADKPKPGSTIQGVYSVLTEPGTLEPKELVVPTQEEIDHGMKKGDLPWRSSYHLGVSENGKVEYSCFPFDQAGNYIPCKPLNGKEPVDPRSGNRAWNYHQNFQMDYKKHKIPKKWQGPVYPKSRANWPGKVQFE